MDTVSHDDADYDPPQRRDPGIAEGGRSNSSPHSEDENGGTRVKNEDAALISARKSKWDRLRHHYNDQYLEIFRSATSPDFYEVQATDLEPSQLGAVKWDADEKAKFFQSLPRVGRHNLPAIAGHVETKSPLEVKDYLDRLQQQVIDRQLFETQPKNVSHAHIPAALEIGRRCEAELENAADALAAFQEHYDDTVGQQQNTTPWIITQDVATQLDILTEERGEEVTSHENAERSPGFHDEEPATLFHLSKFLELSEQFFMNEGPESLHHHWHDLVEESERPSMTLDAVTDLHGILTSLVRRVIQTILFLTMSRIRAATTDLRGPSSTVKKGDVLSALDILGMREDSWDYWVKMPRRRGVRVVAGSHQKGASDKHALSYDEVEAALSVRRHQGRRRSLSVSSSVSSSGVAGKDATIEATGPADLASETDSEFSSPASLSVTDMDMEHDNQQPPGEQHTTDEEVPDPSRSIVPMSKAKRRHLLEKEQDEYLEALDQSAREEEESRLEQILGLDAIAKIKQEPQALGRRPKVLRKTVDEVKIWSGSYVAEWEKFGASPPDADAFESRKRRRINDSNP